MSREIKKKLYLIFIIFFIFVSGSIFLSIQYHKITEDKWTVVYRLNKNSISLNALKFINFEMYKDRYTSKEENIIKDLSTFVNRSSHNNLFDSKFRENIKNIDITINHIKFDYSAIENIDNLVNDALFKLNAKIRDQTIEKIDYLQSRIAQTVYIEKSQKIETLKLRTSNKTIK